MIFTYDRVFKYLTEMLPREEFDKLTFTSVNSLIQAIYETKNQTKEVLQGTKPTLRSFLLANLDLNYL
jgi:hypothetical protein